MGRISENSHVADMHYPSSGCFRFPHDAMGSTFELIACGEDREYARQAAQACFEEVDRLEMQLSRFVEQSDVSRINGLSPGQTARVSPATFECLRLAREVHRETAGAFDVTVSQLVDCWQKGRPSPQELDRILSHTGMDLLELDEEHLEVGVRDPGVRVDLGGIGKGYAVDRMGELLADWAIERGLVHAGKSSVLAAGPPPEMSGWPVALRDPRDDQSVLTRVELSRKALSGSGIRLRGQHIIDPRTGRPVKARLATWASAPSAALSDALSTAFMVMSDSQADEYHEQHPDTAALVIARSPQGLKRTSYGTLGNDN